MKSALVIINGHSRSGQANREEVIQLLHREGMELHTPVIERGSDIPEAIRSWAGQVDSVVLGGGDGTLNSAASALVHSNITLGIVPLGTANDLARTLNIPANIEEACSIILQGHTSAIDVGQVNDQYYFNVANIGLGVEVKKALSEQSKKWWGSLSYAGAALAAFRRQQPFKVEIRSEHHKLVMRTIQVAVGNGRFYGGGMAIHENASITDNYLNLYAIKPTTLWQLLDVTPMFKGGTFQDVEGVVQLNGQHFTVTTQHSMPVSADGEVITSTPAEFKVQPAAVNVFTPGPQG